MSQTLRLGAVRVDVYSTFTGADGAPVQQPILTTTALRADSGRLDLGSAHARPRSSARFETLFERGPPDGQPIAILLPLIEGSPSTPHG